MSGIANLQKQLRFYKDLLANLSRKNRELFYKEVKGSSINLSSPKLVGGEIKEGSNKKFGGLKFLSEDFSSFLSGEEIDLQEHFLVDHLIDPEKAQKIRNRIDKIRLADDKFQREFGISGAWVLGPFLCWRAASNSLENELMITPLFKIPVDIIRNKSKKFILKSESDQLSLNPTFRLALKQACGVEFPEDSSFESNRDAIDKIISSLARSGISVDPGNQESIPRIPSKFKLVKDENGEILERLQIKLEDVLTESELGIYRSTTNTNFILIDVLFLDQLNASRAVLINDYEGIISNGLSHKILNELFNGASLNESDKSDRKKLKELDSYKERQNYFVVDIDSTQHRAIDAARNSRAIVIQGPPGSGKSQTIVNLIADYISKGKRVLFVSEKRPALDVVYNRMKGASIHNQAVLIHSSELNKSELYKSFLELSKVSLNEEDRAIWQETSDKLDRVKTELNCYADAIQSFYKHTGLRVQDLFSLVSQPIDENYFPGIIEAFSQMDFKKIETLSEALREIQKTLLSVPEFNSSPWLKKKANILPSRELKRKLQILHSKIQESRLLIQSTVRRINSFSLLNEELSAQSEAFPSIPPIYLEFNLIAGAFARYKLQRRDVDALVVKLKTLLREIEENKELASSIKKGTPLELSESLGTYYQIPRGPLNWLSADFWSYRSIRKEVCPDWNGTISQFRAYSKSIKATNELLELSIGLSSGTQDKPFEECFSVVEKQVAQLEALRRFFDFVEPILKPDAFAAAIESCDKLDLLVRNLNSIGEDLVKVSERKQYLWSLKAELQDILVEVSKHESMEDFEGFIALLLSRISDLDAFDKVDLLIDKTKTLIDEANLKEKIISSFFGIKGNWSELLTNSILSHWKEEAVRVNPELRTFDRKRREDLCEEFGECLEHHKIASRQEMLQLFAASWRSSRADKSGLKILEKESSKQRRVLSPREVMEKGALETMLQLKPVWLMSPLSISQILPLKPDIFDVIIFDEASQVRVEDAIPSIYRASTMIVVGDDKQMPPTNFFASASPMEEDEEEEELFSSVLDLATQTYPSVLLEWHYRSRSESLIAFSNRAFYGGRLIAAPNPQVLTEGKAIEFYSVEGGYFNGNEGNLREAEMVISKLIEVLKANPNQSVGVIAMGVSQANVLQEELDRRMALDAQISSTVERAMQFKENGSDAGLFIKNLENVQGDERDIILLSIGYAPASPGKKLRMAFGPLSTKGGGRRLNVAITRAKTKMMVFCSFSPSEIETDGQVLVRNPDLCIFGRYLKFAEAIANGNIEIVASILDSFPMAGVFTSRRGSRFSLDVKRRLEEIGYEVSAEIGSNGFFVDLGIHDPIFKNKFIVGIECDGAIFHSTPYARDRDKIRQDLLESRGWKILRVWSQDWSNDWRREIVRLDMAIKEIQKVSFGSAKRQETG